MLKIDIVFLFVLDLSLSFPPSLSLSVYVWSIRWWLENSVQGRTRSPLDLLSDLSVVVLDGALPELGNNSYSVVGNGNLGSRPVFSVNEQNKTFWVKLQPGRQRCEPFKAVCLLLVADGEEEGTVTAKSWGKSHKTVSINHCFWRERYKPK